MNNSVVLSNWSIDAFDCLSSKLYKKLSDELISRVDIFISSVILFDEVFLSENYKNNRIVKELNRRYPNSVKIINSGDLYHSTDMTKHISIDMDILNFGFEKLAQDNELWQIQHDPKIAYEMMQGTRNSDWSHHLNSMNEQKFMTQLRLWHWCYTNEMAELTNSVNMLPRSLNAVGELAIQKKEKSDAVLKNYYEYATSHGQKTLRISELASTPFISELKSLPPFMTLLLSRCKTSDAMTDVLVSMRDEFKEFRLLRHQFTNKIQASSNIGETSAVVADWNSAWQQLVAGEFKKPDLLNRKISSSEFASSIVSVETGGLKTFISHIMDHHVYKKAHKQFQIFSDLEEKVNDVSNKKLLLGDTFGVDDIVPIHS